MSKQIMCWLSVLGLSALMVPVSAELALAGLTKASAQSNYKRTSDEQNDTSARFDELEQQMEQAQQQLQDATRKIARLSREMANGEVMMFMHDFNDHGRRAILGITIDDASDSNVPINFSGVAIAAVSPRGPASEAGVQTGDIIIGLNGSDFSSLKGTAAVEALLIQLKKLKPGDIAALQIKRNDAYLSMDVVTTDVSSVMPTFSWNQDQKQPRDHKQSHAKEKDDEHHFEFDLRGMEELHELPQRLKEGMSKLEGMPGIAMFGGALGFGPRLKLVEVGPELGDYFGVDRGLLLTANGNEHAPGLKAGDVILEINGKAVESEAHVHRAFARVDTGDVLNFGIVRQRQNLSIAVSVPEKTYGNWSCTSVNNGKGKKCKKGEGDSIQFTFTDD